MSDHIVIKNPRVVFTSAGDEMRLTFQDPDTHVAIATFVLDRALALTMSDEFASAALPGSKSLCFQLDSDVLG